jgi:biopolymer transport protein ExbB
MPYCLPPMSFLRTVLSRAPVAGLLCAVCLLGLTPQPALAWWNDAFSQRTRITFNTTAAGVELREPLAGVVVPLRLHSGNFDFIAAKPDGSDLRVLAADDKTELPFVVERFDGTNELAVLWVQLPAVAPGSDKNVVHVYAGNPQATPVAAQPLADAGALAVFRFAEPDGLAADHRGTIKPTAPLAVEANGLIGAAARLAGTAAEWPTAANVQAAAGAPYTVMLWARPDAAGGTLFAQGPLAIGIDGGTVAARLGTVRVAGGQLAANAWVHVALTVGGGKAALFVNGARVGEADLPAGAPAIAGALRVGAAYNGLIDELQIAAATRSAEWLRFTHAAQSADAKLVASVLQPRGSDQAAEGGGGGGYIGILVKNLTVDAWAVIILCGVMLVVAVWVMVAKAMLIGRTDRGNRAFLDGFRGAHDVLDAEGPQAHPGSSIARLYDAGKRELGKRDIAKGRDAVISGASLDAVKAAVDADLVRENHRLNNWMVLLTIAISGGPFLGLLGTVVGVMITFAAIAAAGDVNVNAIAPGIAAALLATVAGLGVAIPALFGYNYLASRIKNISADMQIFVDEFVTRVAERYGAR